jgi:ferredoxin
MFKRLADSRLREPIRVQVLDEELDGQPGETLAASLLAAGWPRQGRSLAREDLARRPAWNYYCGIGVCGECRVTLPDGRSVKACQYENESGADLPPDGRNMSVAP